MSYKIVVLQSKEQLIAEIKEVISGDKPVAYLLTNPHIVELNRFSMSEDENNETSIEITLSPWILSTSEKEIPIPINHVVALVDPLDSIKKMYLEKTNGQSNQTDSVEQQGDLVE
tara:strand:- start:330 stop:674 length:345 start_codon:yes stop_codon:yes gene_type:complete